MSSLQPSPKGGSPRAKNRAKRPSQMLGAFVDKQLGEYLDISDPIVSPSAPMADEDSWVGQNSPRERSRRQIPGLFGSGRDRPNHQAPEGSLGRSRFGGVLHLNLKPKEKMLYKMNSEIFERQGIRAIAVPATLHSDDAQSNLLTSPLKGTANSDKYRSIGKMDQSLSMSNKPAALPTNPQVDPLHPEFIEKVISVFRDIPPSQRTKEQYKECLPFLMTMSYIKKIMEQPPTKVPSEEIVFKIFKSMEYKHVQAGEIIFREREFGSYVYTILEGTLQVSVMLTRDEQNQNQSQLQAPSPAPPVQPPPQTNPLDLFKMKKIVPKRLQLGENSVAGSEQPALSEKLASLGEAVMKTQDGQANPKTGADEQAAKTNTGGAFLGNLGLAVFKRTESQGAVRSVASINWAEEKIIRPIGPGTTFGDIALTVATKRTATIVSLTRASMLMLHRDVFSKIMGKDVEEKKQQNIRRLDFNLTHSHEIVDSNTSSWNLSSNSCENQIFLSFLMW